mmetsp:Transcript_10232/g.8688  ORF Transcript_10232/g.8688 Transcript_10232/m.8688 type:complete len:82 (-) Transcript_10232:41-286(-)
MTGHTEGSRNRDNSNVGQHKGDTGLVLIALNCFALLPLVKKQPAYKDKVQPALAKVTEALKNAEAKVAGMLERKPKATKSE